jgi:hypothetical protein
MPENEPAFDYMLSGGNKDRHKWQREEPSIPE